jgi:hypothetical protein
MTMAQKHLIDCLQIDMVVPRANSAFELQNQVSELVANELTAHMTEVCDAFAGSDRHVIVERLEIDLGRVSAQSFRQQLVERFRNRFNAHRLSESAVLREIHLPIDMSSNATSDGRSDAARDQSAADGAVDSDGSAGQLHLAKAVAYFLEHGRLPWFVDADEFAGIEQAFLQLLQHNSPLHIALAPLQQRERSLDRLLLQVSEPMLVRLYAALKPEAAGIDWSAFIEFTVGLGDQLTGRKPATTSIWRELWRNKARPLADGLCAVWQVLQGDSALTPDQWQREIIRHETRLMDSCGFSAAQLQASLRYVANPTSGILAEDQDLSGPDRTRPSPDADDPSFDHGMEPRHKPLAYDDDPAARLAKDTLAGAEGSDNSQPIVQSNAGRQAAAQAGAETDAVNEPDKASAAGNTQLSPIRHVVHNAGISLLAPFLTTLFSELEWLDGSVFRHESAQHRAMHLLHYLAYGEPGAEEHAMLLNKFLCGWPLDKPLPRFVGLQAHELAEADQLLQAVIGHWSVLGNTSIDSLRGTFIRRRGILRQDDRRWVLQVEKGPYDILIDRIPWAFSSLRLGWMDDLLEVQWQR